MSLFFVVLLVTGTLVRESAGGTTYTEGQFSGADAVFANCTIDVKGTWAKVLELTLPFKTRVPGAIISFINVLNNKPVNEQGTITKTAGGLWTSSVTFRLLSVESHGFLFEFHIYGRVPLGASPEPPLVGICHKF